MDVFEMYESLKKYLRENDYRQREHADLLKFVEHGRRMYRRENSATPGLDKALEGLKSIQRVHVRRLIEFAKAHLDIESLEMVSLELRQLYPSRGRPKANFKSFEEFEEYWKVKIGEEEWKTIAKGEEAA